MDVTLSYFCGYFAFGFAVGVILVFLVVRFCVLREDHEYDDPIDL